MKETTNPTPFLHWNYPFGPCYLNKSTVINPTLTPHHLPPYFLYLLISHLQFISTKKSANSDSAYSMRHAAVGLHHNTCKALVK